MQIFARYVTRSFNIFKSNNNRLCNCWFHFRKVTPQVDAFKLDFFMDGLPLHKSGPKQFWPILMKIYGMISVPVMVIAIFCGDAKPESAEDYLRQFVTELNELQDKGVFINGRKFSVAPRAIIADSPARAFIKGKHE